MCVMCAGGPSAGAVVLKICTGWKVLDCSYMCWIVVVCSVLVCIALCFISIFDVALHCVVLY